MERIKKLNTRRCIKCKKPTNLELKVDLDIKGFPVCKDHTEEVKKDLYLLMCGADDDIDFVKWFNKKYDL